MWANNEAGVLFPVDRIAEICRSRGVLYHCDAVQAAGRMEIDVRKVPADYLSLTRHKFHAPKGIGALYVRRRSPFSPLAYGGRQERNRRGATEDVLLIVATGSRAVVTIGASRRREKFTEPDFALLARAFNGARAVHPFYLTAWVFLPDPSADGHCIGEPVYPATISLAMKSVKQSSTDAVNQRRGAEGELWQPRFFDRALRTVKEYNEKVEYIYLNPVRAGLVSRPEDWRRSSYHE
jgi:cysteine sulfinate desulfinase/cysteine desulfurase-like protein